MKKPTRLSISVDEQGRLAVPADLLAQAGLIAGGSANLTLTEQGLSITRATDSLARVYVEPTSACNLDCRTCMRHAWDEPVGRMSAETFARVLDGVRSFNPRPLVFFGGYGEPLAHPDILEMAAAAKAAGAQVELISNGILLDRATAERLATLPLDRLWVSIDGASPASYADVRLGDALPQVIENLSILQQLRSRSGQSLPRLGIAFVAMRRNLADLPEVVRLGKRLGADLFSVSNLLAHSPELRDEILYARSMYDAELQPSVWSPVVGLPRLDPDVEVLEGVAEILKGRSQLELARRPIGGGANCCPFVEKGSLAVRWDGAVSPCLPLLHTHTSYLGEHLRTSQAWAVGNLNERGLVELWNDPGYTRLRERLIDFDFSPCTFCNSCEMAEGNQEDCFGNGAPACGGCLWAQGFIQCP